MYVWCLVVEYMYILVCVYVCVCPTLGGFPEAKLIRVGYLQ